MATSTELDGELQCILALLYQGVKEVDDSVAVAMDLSFMESVAAGLKEMRERHSRKWQDLKEQRQSANKVDQKLKDKGVELRDWHSKQFQALLRHQEIISMGREDVIAREARLVECKALLDAREQDISLREERLKAILHAKDDELDTLVQRRTKELEDGHKAALDVLATDSAAELKKLADELAAASSAKTDLDQQVAKLNEELAGSAKEGETLKEEARKVEALLNDVRSQLSSKDQGLADANGTIKELKARIGSLESSMESTNAREKQLANDLDTARRLRKDAEDRLENHSGQVDLWIKSLVDTAGRLTGQAEPR